MKIQVCTGKMCMEKYSGYILKRLKADIETFNLEGIIVEESPCMGMCKVGPNVKFDKHLENNCNPIKTSKMMFDKINNKK